MNLELLKEIKELRAKKMSDTDVSSFLGISKANMLLMIRIENIVKNNYLNEIESLKINNIQIEQLINSQNKEIEKKDNLIEDLKFEDIEKLKSKLNLKVEEFKILEKDYNSLNERYNLLYSKYYTLPSLVRKYL